MNATTDYHKRDNRRGRKAVAAILLQAEKYSEQIDAAEAALLAVESGVYQRDGIVVRVTRDPDTDRLRVTPVGERHVAELMGDAVDFTRWDIRSHQEVPAKCPIDFAQAYLARPATEWRLPRLTGIQWAPTLRADASILQVPGYDRDTGLILEHPQITFGEVSENPGIEEVAEAADMLEGLLKGFPFVSEVDKAVALAAILTAAIRRSLPTAPMFAFTAPAPGTGKSYLVDLIATIATGKPASGFTWTADDAENRKQLDAALLAGTPIIALDNVAVPLGGDRLNQIITQASATMRVLGESRIVETPCRALVMANGNNLTVAADMTRRTLLCRLDAGVEQPELRTFATDPLRLVTADPGRYLWAALTILRGYHAAGRPDQFSPLGSFGEWSSWVRGALDWCFFDDPVESMAEVRAADPVRSNHAAILDQWNTVLGDRRVTSRQIIDAAMTAPEFRESLLVVAGAAGAINTARLGSWLRSVKGRLVDGLKLMPGSQIRGSTSWTLVGGRDAGRVVIEFSPADRLQ